MSDHLICFFPQPFNYKHTWALWSRIFTISFTLQVVSGEELKIKKKNRKKEYQSGFH